MEKEKIIQYISTGKKVSIEDCIDDKKTKELISNIEKANITDKEKEFLKLAAYRHLVFNYNDIAEYYANADKEVQKLMEDSALVIVDINDAIANGFLKLYDNLDKIEGKNE